MRQNLRDGVPRGGTGALAEVGDERRGRQVAGAEGGGAGGEAVVVGREKEAAGGVGLVEEARFVDEDVVGAVFDLDAAAAREDDLDVARRVRLGALLSETLTFESIGPVLPADELFLFNIAPAKIAEGVAEGQVFMLLKTFGNLTFTIGTDEFENTGIRHGDPVHVTFTKDGKTVWEADTTFQPSFGYVPEGEPVIFNGSSGYLDIGLNKHSFIARCLPQIAEDDPLAYYVRIEKKEAK